MIISISLSIAGLILFLTGIVVLTGGDGVQMRQRYLVGFALLLAGSALFAGAAVTAAKW